MTLARKPGSLLPVSFVLACLLASIAGVSCKKDVPTGTPDGGAGADSAASPVVISDAGEGASDGGIGKRPTTTSWSIAINNLDAIIKDRIRRNETRTDQRLYLVEVLLERGQYLANVEDYEHAEDIAKALIAGAPKDGASHYARALTLGAFHKFEEELKELDAASQADKTFTSRAEGTRAGVFMALGRYDDAEKAMPPVDKVRSPIGLVSAAVLAGHMQKIDESEALFERARNSIVDVSPFPVAWMDFQRALLLEGRGNESRARLYYAEACAAIPSYVHAAVHLAATDTPEDAVKRLEELRKTSTDPDVLAALAEANKKLHKDDEAKTLTDLAKARYNELVAKHPEAYRDHAARFWLAGGNDPKKALDYAEKNAALRPTEEAIDLWMGAAAAATKKDAICKSASAMSGLRYASEARKRLAAAALNDCPDAGPGAKASPDAGAKP